MLEDDSVRSQTVEEGAGLTGVAVASKMVGPKGIDDDDHDVRLPLRDGSEDPGIDPQGIGSHELCGRPVPTAADDFGRQLYLHALSLRGRDVHGHRCPVGRTLSLPAPHFRDEERFRAIALSQADHETNAVSFLIPALAGEPEGRLQRASLGQAELLPD